MRSRREDVARSAGGDDDAITDCDALPVTSPGWPGQSAVPPADPSEPLTEPDAEAHVHGICFKTGPPGRVGVELEWLVHDSGDPATAVDHRRVSAVRAALGARGALPGHGTLTVEPGGQIELSSAPSATLGECISDTRRDLAVLRQAASATGLTLAGQGLDPLRRPRRVLDEPRYTAMEEFFDRSGPWGRVMMCSTASVQVSLEAGEAGTGPAGFRWRWSLLHSIGPVLVAAFANSPVRAGRPTGWKSTRQAVWARLDPTRTRPPPPAGPFPAARSGAAWPPDTDPRSTWVSYALDAKVMCVRRPGAGWAVPEGLTFRDWLRGAGERPPTRDDLLYHLSTLFPPVRPRGHLEFRAIDAQDGDDWIVPVAVLTALLDDPAAAQEAMASAEPLWQGAGPQSGNGRPNDGGNGLRTSGGDGAGPGLWLRAARLGPADPSIAAVSRRCFEAAESALSRLGAAPATRNAVTSFAERYVVHGRCPADDRLAQARAGERRGGSMVPGAGRATSRRTDATLEDRP